MAPEHSARVERIVAHDADTRSLFLRQTDGERIAFRPGQFISCLIPSGSERLIRPYSIASDPDRELMEICLNRVPGGPGSAYLLGLEQGATVHFTGPWGTFVLDHAPDAEAIFIADGTGIAPIRPMIHRALATAGGRIGLLYATEPGAPVLYRAEVDDLARRHERFTLAHVSSAALRDEVTRRWVDGDRDRSRRFFICGVGAIVPTLRDVLRGAGYERRAVQYEKW